MAHFDDFSNLHKNHQSSARECEAEGGPGEREYFEHVCAQKMSRGERVVTFMALVFVAVIGVVGYLGNSTASARQAPVAAEITQTQHWQHEMECEVYERRC